MNRPPRHQHWRSLSTAFMAWLASQSSELRREIAATKRQGRVRLLFPRFPMLVGYVRHHCLAVFAQESPGRGRSWLFDVDCLPIILDGVDGFICGFCEGAQKTFATREDVFIDHLFEPFGRWVTGQLVHAQGIAYRQVGKSSVARLKIPGDPWLPVDEVDHLRSYRNLPPPKKGTF